MKFRSKKLLSLILALGMVTSSLAPAATAEAAGTTLVGDIQKDRYVSGQTINNKAYPDDEDTNVERDDSEFMKISHPEIAPNRRDHDPTTEDDPDTKDVNEHDVEKAAHEKEVHADGLIDYMGNGVLGAPGKDGNGKGARGQSYSWTGIAHGDWMYVSTQYNSAGATGDIMGTKPDKEQAEKRFGGDYFTGEEDGGYAGSTLSKINVKTGETVILMSKSKNGLDAQFRASIEYKGKLYFCGGVNHVPSIYEVDPENDALQCVYRDPSMINYPGNPEKGYPPGVAGAWKEAKDDNNICPTIRGITTFTTKGGKEYLVISCVGVDGNPYIAVSDDPSKGKFDIIAHAWEKVPTYLNDGFKTEGGEKGELFGYPACHLRDSIFGGSIWEMVQFDGKLYVAMCTGTPETAKTHEGEIEVEDKDGNKKKEPYTFIDTMQSFALVCGELVGDDITSKDSWEWTPIVGDKEADGAKYTFGIDPQRTRAGACNLVVFGDHLYVGEYNDTQIAFMNMNKRDFKFLKENLEQSISYYRLGKDQTFEKVMGSPTDMFPHTVSGKYEDSGFGQKSSQYIWQSRVFDGKLYFGTFDETMILQPLAKEAGKNMEQHQKSVEPELQSVSVMIDSQLAEEELEEVAAATESATESATEAVTEAATEEAVTEEVATEEAATEEAATEEAVTEESVTFTADLSKDEFAKLREVRNDFSSMKENGQLYSLDDIDTQSGTVLAPKEIFERESLVKIESTEDLYLALLVLDDLMKTPAKGGVVGDITKFVDFMNLKDEISTYAADPANEVPEYMAASVKASEGTPDQQESYKEIQYVVENLKGCVAGFDMYVSEDGTNFKQITRSGLGDPFNQGLRAFAANESKDNKWMSVGSANGFWGTSIYRMNTGATVDIVDPAQNRIKVEFINEDGNNVPVDSDKSAEIFVDAGKTTVTPHDIVVLTPRNHKIVNPEKAVTVENGIAKVNVKADYAIVLNYKDNDKTIKTVKVAERKGAETVNKKLVTKNMPEGYALIDPEADIKIQPSVDEEQNDFADINIGKVFNVTVKNGKTQNEKVAQGSKITITANNAPEGQVFDKWIETTEAEEGVTKTAVEFADATAAETTFVMPGNDVSVEATFKTAEPEVEKFAVTVNGGKSDVAEAAKGDTVKVTAEVPEGKVFVNWTGEGVEFADATAAETTFVMPEKAVTVTANFKDPDAEKFTITVNGGKANVSEAKKGETVTIKAKVTDGRTFVNWSGEGVEFADAKAVETTFVMPGKDVTITANFDTQDGWVEADGNKYYYVDGEKVTDWKFIEGEWYFFNKSGIMQTGWLHVSGPASDTFYLKEDGKMARGWCVIEGKWYYFNQSGVMQTGWIKVNNSWFYMNASGVMQTGWQYIDGYWYYLNESGYMKTGWQYIDGYWYYMNGSGQMKTGWVYAGGYWSYTNGSGQMKTGWVYVDGNWFYMNGSGYMVTGWAVVDNTWYYFKSNGAMVTGWAKVGSSWYYFKPSGAMVTGWYKVGNAWYYFYGDGHMASNTTIDGCRLNSSGAWV